MTGGVVAGLLAAGIVLAYSGWSRTRRPALDDRVAPYVRDILPDLAPTSSGGAAAAVFGPVVRRAAAFIGDAVGSPASVRRRLARAGDDSTVDEFRVRQLVWGGGGFAIASGLAALAWRSGSAASPVLLVLCASGFVAGVLACDQRLGTRVRQREQRIAEEFPVVAEMLALAVAAGESPVAGLQRIVGIAHGDLADELARVLAEIRTGTPIAVSFDRLAARTGVVPLARFAEALAVAVERGTPLTDVLHAQAADVRESARRDLMESGGRREVLMMVPVVFGILPVTVVFAFFPGFIGLHLTSGS